MFFCHNDPQRGNMMSHVKDEDLADTLYSNCMFKLVHKL